MKKLILASALGLWGQAALAAFPTQPPNSIPEPGIWALLLAGGIAYAIVNWRNRK